MDSVETDQLEHRLTDAIGQLQADIQTIEIWAAAVVGFAQPVPEGQARIRGVEILGN